MSSLNLSPSTYTFREPEFYGKCAVGGSLACGSTRPFLAFLDVHKCRTACHPKDWPAPMRLGLRKLAAEEGLRGLTIGWGPTLCGYGAQGMCKFGLNEFFQDVYAGAIGGRQMLDTKAKRLLHQGVSSASAEVFADIALCPFEMTKVKMQVELPAGTWARSGMFGAMGMMNAQKAETKFPFGSLKPLWGRQVPYTVIKFVVFYQAAEFVYDQLLKKGYEKKDISSGKQLAITFGCGYFAGVFCAVATQPMDNLVSMAGAKANQGKSFGQMANEMGYANLFKKGLGTRIVMVGTLTGFQWWIYGSFKSAMGFGTM